MKIKKRVLGMLLFTIIVSGIALSTPAPAYALSPCQNMCQWGYRNCTGHCRAAFTLWSPDFDRCYYSCSDSYSFCDGGCQV